MFKKISKNPIFFGVHISTLHKKYALAALLFVFVATAFSRYSVVVLKNLTDAISASPHDIHSVWIWAGIYAGLFFISETIWRASGFSGMNWFMNLRASAYQVLYEYLSLHSKDYFNSRFAGSLTNKIANAVDGTEMLFEQILWQFMPLILGLFWYVIFAWQSNVGLGMIIAVWSVIFLSMNIWFAVKLNPVSVESAASLSTLKGRIVDSLSNISLVHEYAYVDGERKYIQKFIRHSRTTGITTWRLSEWMLFANNTMLFLFMSSMIGVSVYLFQNHTISMGVVIMIITIVGNLSYQLLFLGQEIRNAAKFYGEAKEGLTEILQKHLLIEIENAVPLQFKEGTVSLKSVDFEYDNKKVFRDFSLTIHAGQKVGIVGKSGAGKTTFASLLLRHYDVQNGAITIDDQDISKVTLESLRRVIAFVPQDTSLFHRSILENIRYSNPDAQDSDVICAAQMAQAHEFIKKLPQGYETLVGERGVKLSGGQRQRIAIARAFLKNAPILILDEATSSLDSESEHAIQESLEKLMKERTVIAIAHRLSTLKKMDRIVVMEDGKIVEDGDPNDLLNKKEGFFKKLWDHQVKGFIIDE